MTRPVRERTIGDYLDQLASNAPTPGGGSVAGVIAALAMALGRMVVSLSEASGDLTTANEQLITATRRAIDASDADEHAYGGYIAATRLPKSDPDKKVARKQAMQLAMRDSAETPMRLAEVVTSMKPVLQQVADGGNPLVVSDAAIALVLADAAIQACLINVRVNLPYINDAGVVDAFNQRISNLG